MSKDTVYREDAIKALRKLGHEVVVIDKVCSLGVAAEFIDAIRAIPTADRPQGECLKEAEILLKATRNLLNKQNESIYVLNMLEETVTYYGVECDGSCLIEDIDAWLELYGSEEGVDDE